MVGITTFTDESYEDAKRNKPETWSIFEKKSANLGTLVYSKDIFKKYVKHVVKKFINNGYQRVEFRSILKKLTNYDEKGNFLGKLPESEFAECFD